MLVIVARVDQVESGLGADEPGQQGDDPEIDDPGAVDPLAARQIHGQPQRQQEAESVEQAVGPDRELAETAEIEIEQDWVHVRPPVAAPSGGARCAREGRGSGRRHRRRCTNRRR